jgi:putative N6-adenine-specific DNA methylase
VFAKLDTWSKFIISSYEDTEKYIGVKANKNRKIYNGMLRTYYYQFLGPKPPKRRMGEEL